MKFKPATEGHAKMMKAYISTCGNYKVARYGKKWSAYFKLGRSGCFGDSCRKTTGGETCEYDTRKQAEADCLKHSLQSEYRLPHCN